MKIATVPYRNTLPLIRFFEGAITHAVPSALAELLDSGSVDAALLPVADGLSGSYHLYPECGLIGCDGPVQSVGFFTQPWVASLNQISSIYWDTDSRTSILLARHLLRSLFGVNANDLKSVSASQKENADAQLLIGDKALFYTGERRFWDLGKLWNDLTGTGFVFACWASKRPLDAGEIQKLQNAKVMGLKNLNVILSEEPAEARTVLENYFKQAIVYEFTHSLEAGLNLFRRMIS